MKNLRALNSLDKIIQKLELWQSRYKKLDSANYSNHVKRDLMLLYSRILDISK